MVDYKQHIPKWLSNVFLAFALVFAIGLYYYVDSTTKTVEANFASLADRSARDVVRTTAILYTTKGDVTLELFDDLAPKTVKNFVTLAEKGFYNGTKIHRVIPNFIIQGGDPLTADSEAPEALYGTGGPGYTFPDEFGEGLSNVRGTISMANSGPNTNGSQFFINLADNTFLDADKEPLTSKHAVFGVVKNGLSVADEMGSVPRNERDLPNEPIVIERIEIRK